MFFHKINFRGSNDIEIYFDTNLVPYCFPKSIQKRWKCRSQEVPDNASIFASFLNPQNLPLGIQLGTILALSFASRRPKRPSRTPLTRLLFYLRAFLFLLTRLLFYLRTYDRFLTDFWSIFGRLFIDFWLICWSILVGPQNKYLNVPGYFFLRIIDDGKVSGTV